MLQSTLFPRTGRQPPRGEASVNAQLLEQAGFIAKMMAGVYAYLPLGLRVLRQIEDVIREGMNALGAQELFLPALQPKELWDKTGRWAGLKDVMYQFRDHSNHEVGLGVTHEEVVADIVRRSVTSYKQLPIALYQIQTKFRHELRPKSGLTRGREFSMKDLYSCHTTQDDCDAFYERVKGAYTAIFQKLGLETRIVEASGGSFSKEYSHEFQVLTDGGEDHVVLCSSCSFAQNREIATAEKDASCPQCGKKTLSTARAIEVGNIFKLGTTYTRSIGALYVDAAGKQQPIVMASYGIGPSRVLGTVVELHHDDRGIVWPESVAPFSVHVIHLGTSKTKFSEAKRLANTLEREGVSVLFDDRCVSAGEKLHDADLLGIPHRVIVSDRTDGEYEYRRRDASTAKRLKLAQLKRTVRPL